MNLDNNLTKLIDKNFPLISKEVKIKNLNSPWLDKKLLKLVDKKHKLFKNYKNGICTFEYFKTFRNSLNRTLELAKKIYFRDKFSNVDSQNESWKLINNCMNKNSKSRTVNLKLDKVLTLDRNKISESFRKFFRDSVQELVTSAHNTKLECLIDPLPHNFIFHPIRETEVLVAIKI